MKFGIINDTIFIGLPEASVSIIAKMKLNRVSYRVLCKDICDKLIRKGSIFKTSLKFVV